MAISASAVPCSRRLASSRPKRARADEGIVRIQDRHVARAEQVHGLESCVGRSKTLVLDNGGVGSDLSFQGGHSGSRDHDDRVERLCGGVDDVPDERQSAEDLHCLGRVGAHARAEAGRQDDRCVGHRDPRAVNEPDCVPQSIRQQAFATNAWQRKFPTTGPTSGI